MKESLKVGRLSPAAISGLECNGQSPLGERLPHYSFRYPVLCPHGEPLTLTEHRPLSIL